MAFYNRVVDGQTQRHCAVATRNIDGIECRVRVRSRIVCNPMPRIASASIHNHRAVRGMSQRHGNFGAAPTRLPVCGWFRVTVYRVRKHSRIRGYHTIGTSIKFADIDDRLGGSLRMRTIRERPNKTTRGVVENSEGIDVKALLQNTVGCVCSFPSYIIKRLDLNDRMSRTRIEIQAVCMVYVGRTITIMITQKGDSVNRIPVKRNLHTRRGSFNCVVRFSPALHRKD